jgi:glutamate N-acetyltransferase/amino-acid N-acetyltransferase
MKKHDIARLPQGFSANGMACGLKKTGAPDLALVYSERPCRVAAMFTTNTIVASPVLVCKEHLKRGSVFRAIIANSGNANCFNGEAGMRDARAMAHASASALGLRDEEVFVASTGIIGKRLDTGKIVKAVPALTAGLSRENFSAAKRAIMTTDKFSKELSVSFKAGGKTVTVSGFAKGAGMIAPNMATMLAFVMTDAVIGRKALDSALRDVVARTFNCITVDGCMSTNDTIIAMANGAACNREISSGRDYKSFTDALYAVCIHIARQMVADGEGSTKIIKITVSRAKTAAEARTVALAIANSNLSRRPFTARILISAG